MTLKTFDPSHNLDDLYKMYLNPEYGRFFRHFEPFMSEVEFWTSVNASGSKVLGTDEGYVFIRHLPRTKSGEVSVVLRQDAQGKGSGIKTMLEIGELLFKDYGCERILINVSADDIHTNEIAKKGGFELEAVHRKACFYDHRLHDENRYVMTREIFMKEYGG